MTSPVYGQKEKSIQEEIEGKHEKLRGLLQTGGYEAVLLRSNANFSWITAGGLNILSAYSSGGVSDLVLTPEHRYVIASNIESPRMQLEERMEEKGFELIRYPWYEEADLSCIIEDRIGPVKHLASDTDVPSATNIAGQIQKLRYQLTAGEKERYFWLGDRVSRIIERVAVQLHPGVRESEVAAQLAGELWRQRIEPLGFQIGADERAENYRHPIPTMKPAHSLLLINVIVRYAGLITTVSRAVHFGQPSDTSLRQYRDNVRIESEMIACTKPGAEVQIPFNRAVNLYRELGYGEEWKNHHQGGAMGYAPREYRVDFSTQATVLEGQAFCWNPSIAGTKTEDGFIATSEGPQFITHPVRFPTLEFAIGGHQLVRPDMLIL